MQINLTIQNGNKEIFNMLKAFMKTQPSVKYKLKEQTDWNDEFNELMQDYKSGKIKPYTTAKEMHKDIFND